jgi:hypothetical protein
MVLLDIADRQIRYVEVIDEGDLRALWTSASAGVPNRASFACFRFSSAEIAAQPVISAE